MDAPVYDVVERLACRRCVGDRQLRAELADAGFAATCDYCGRPGDCVDVAWLADRIHAALQSAFVAVPGGAAVDTQTLLETACALPPALARDVYGRLVALYRDADGTPLYGAAHGYAEHPPTAVPFGDWAAFAAAARESPEASADALLDTLKWAFASIDLLRTPKGRPAIRVLEPGRKICVASRNANGTDAAAPLAIASLDARTAISELRPPRDVTVLVERRTPVRPLLVFDADAARKALGRTHCFIADRADRRARAAFVAAFAAACAEPIAADAGAPVAGVRWAAAWLAYGTRRLDGIVVRSAFGEGRRLLLFPSATASGALTDARRRRYVIARLRLDCRRTRDARTAPARD